MSVARQRRATHKARKKKQAQQQREQFEQDLKRMRVIPTASHLPLYVLDTSALRVGLASLNYKRDST